MTPFQRKHHIVRRSKSPLIWYLIIGTVVLLIAAILGLRGGLISFIEDNANVLDTQYIPMDLDRRTQDALKGELKHLDEKKLDDLKKRFQDKMKDRSKP